MKKENSKQEINGRYTIAHPQKEDGNKIWNLIKRVGNLDLNSEYCYFMLSDVLRKQCAVATQSEDGKIVGFASSIVKPESPDTLFVWQVCIDESAKRQGLAKGLLNFILRNQAYQIKFIETTISDDNKASQALFTSLARDHGAQVEVTTYIDDKHFENSHDTEYLYTIGQLNAEQWKK